MKIKFKLHSIFIINILLAVLIGLCAYYFLKKVIFYHAETEIKHLDKAFVNLERNDARTLASSLELFTNDSSFKKAFMEKNRDQLYAYSKPLFETMKRQYGITHFYFILPNGKCFLRVHNKDLYGDTISRAIFEKAKEGESTISGIELGKTAFALRVVMPYYYKNKLIGYVEFAEEIDHFLKILEEETSNTTLALVVNKKYLDIEKFNSVKEVAGKRNNWNDLKDYPETVRKSRKTLIKTRDNLLPVLY